MSMEVYVFLQEERLPDVAAWQRAIEQAGFKARLEGDFDLRHDNGFRPGLYAGEATGFEFYLESAEAIAAQVPGLADRIGDRSHCAMFAYGGDLTEMCQTLASAAALAQLADGIYFDPQADLLCSGEEAVREAHETINSI